MAIWKVPDQVMALILARLILPKISTTASAPMLTSPTWATLEPFSLSTELAKASSSSTPKLAHDLDRTSTKDKVKALLEALQVADTSTMTHTLTARTRTT